jgi:hypothetical protein
LEDSSIAVFSTGETTVAEDAGEARTIFWAVAVSVSNASRARVYEWFIYDYILIEIAFGFK